MRSSVHVETLQDPRRYTAAQLDRARRLAEHLGRGRFVLCERPAR